MSKNVKIKIFSDNNYEISTITSIVNQLTINGNKIICQTPFQLKIEPDDVIIFQLSNIKSNLLDNFLKLKTTFPNKFIVITESESALFISSLLKLGFINIFLFPHEIPGFISYLTDIISNNLFLTSSVNKKNSELYNFNSIVGTSEKFLAIIDILRRVSESKNVSVLLLGETGTGKGLLAKAIHENSNKANSPFIEIICSAIPEDLLESELFGHEKGAFTNAYFRKLGLFELAENGTIFLDEVGDLSLNLQVKLLRVIEKKIIRRLGGVDDIPVNTRIISATNRDLYDLVEKNLFRKDLYHRLNVISIILPPLRERENDTILLAEKFIEEFNDLFNKSIDSFEDGLKEFLLSYSWPGNVRELRNAIERAVLLSDDNTLRVNDFTILLKDQPLNIIEKKESWKFHPYLVRLELNYQNIDLLKLDKLYAKEVLKKLKGNKFKSAKFLGISRPKLDKLLDN